MFNFLNLSLPLLRWAGHNTNLHANSNISKALRLSIDFLEDFKRIINKLSNGIMIDTLCTCDFQVIDV